MSFAQNLSFRQKILITHLLAFILTLAAVLPFSSYSVKRITKTILLEQADNLISQIKGSSSKGEMVKALQILEHSVFFRVSVIDKNRQVAYDQTAEDILEEGFDPSVVIKHTEVESAFYLGTGYAEDYSSLLDQDLAYMARRFKSHGDTYVLRTAFPMVHVAQFTRHLLFGLLVLSVALLSLSSLLTWLLVAYITKPVQQIINAIQPYQEGEISHIHLENISSHDDIGKLATTLNSLSKRVKSQIDTLLMERNEKEAVLESLNEGVLVINAEKEVIYSNTTALRLLHLNAKTMKGLSIHQINEPLCEELLDKCIAQNNPVSGTLKQTEKGKRLLNLVAAPHGSEGEAMLVIQDISSQNQALEMSKDFIANASHELKTPITIIRGFAETLHDYPELTQQKRVEISDKIVRNSARMAHLVEDLLTLAELEHGTTSNENPCDLIEILENCHQLLLNSYPDANLKITMEGNPPFSVHGNRDLIELSLHNLLSNAARYSEGAAEITVHIKKTENAAVISFSDKGIGIPQEDLEHIFDRFYTVDKGRSRAKGGTGLGLSITQSVIQRHRGSIEIESTVGKGTTITVTLPSI